MWTDLHAALGEVPGPLTFQMVQQACSVGVQETAGLDWKRDLPLPDGLSAEAKETKVQDLASDLAAMGNSGGGLIVYGVDQRRDVGRGTAEHVVPVGEYTDALARDIRRVAASRVAPRLVDLEVIHLAPEEDPGGGVLAVWVEDSVDAPHLVSSRRQQDYFTAPYRNGPDTQRMSERQLEIAYRQRLWGREQRARSRRERFAELVTDLVGRAGGGCSWGVVLAVPVVAGPSRSPTGALHQAVWAAASRRTREMRYPGEWGPLIELAIAQPSPRPGLRAAVWAATQDKAAVHVSVGDEGTIALAFTRWRGLEEVTPHGGRAPAVLEDLVSAVFDLHPLLEDLAPLGLVRGDYQVLLGVAPSDAVCVQQDPFGPGGRFVQIEEAGVFRPVEMFLPVSAGPPAVQEALQRLATDAYHQMGLRLPRP